MATDHHSVVVTDRGGGLGTGMILGIIVAAIVVLALVWFLFFGPGLGGAPSNPGTNQQQQEQPQQPAPGDGY
jgi:hypothetical protein